jgi:proline dehydrogenase
MKWFNWFVVQMIPLFPKSFIWLFSRKYVAGVKLEEAIQQVKDLNGKSVLATMDVLGEDIMNLEEAGKARKKCIETLCAISEKKLESGLSVKLTQLGLCIDKEKCYQNVEAIVKKASENHIFVRIDMEDHTTTDATLEIYRRLRRKYKRVGIVIQAYLKRSQSDVEGLIRDGIANVRICKGIYIEPAAIAYKDREEIRNNYMKLTEMILEKGEYAAIATHDEQLVRRSYEKIREVGKKPVNHEFQMLLGVTEKLRQDIIRNRHHMRVYVPYGEQWHGYCMRRMKENPQVAGYVIKSLFIRK